MPVASLSPLTLGGPAPAVWLQAPRSASFFRASSEHLLALCVFSRTAPCLRHSSLIHSLSLIMILIVKRTEFAQYRARSPMLKEMNLWGGENFEWMEEEVPVVSPVLWRFFEYLRYYHVISRTQIPHLFFNKFLRGSSSTSFPPFGTWRHKLKYLIEFIFKKGLFGFG